MFLLSNIKVTIIHGITLLDLIPFTIFVSLGGDTPTPGTCGSISGIQTKGKSDKWKGKEWNVALNADEYGITGIDSCMEIACLPYKNCEGVSWHPNPPSCYVWDSCDLENLQGPLPHYSLKRGITPGYSLIYSLNILADIFG